MRAQLESRDKIELFVSELVVGEISNGDPNAGKWRMTVLENLAELALTDQAEAIAAKLLLGAALSQKAKELLQCALNKTSVITSRHQDLMSTAGPKLPQY
jgi:hypothetical protein